MPDRRPHRLVALTWLEAVAAAVGRLGRPVYHIRRDRSAARIAEYLIILSTHR